VTRDLDAALPTVVDLPDGSFEHRPDPRVMRQTKRALGYYAVVPLRGDFSEKVKGNFANVP